MAALYVSLKAPLPDGSLAPAPGALRFTPTARRTAGADVVVPAPFTVELDAEPSTVRLALTSEDWVWRIEEFITGLPGRKFYAAIGAAYLNYADLVPIDPTTLTPTADPDPMWWAALQAAQLGVSATVAPDDPSALLVIFPSWRQWPGDSDSIMMPVEVAQ